MENACRAKDGWPNGFDDSEIAAHRDRCSCS
jgi:hypothetical protein